jgi:DNA processing protein
VPGSPLAPRANDPNRPIREGTTLTESAEDVLAVQSPKLGGNFREPDASGPTPVADTLEAEADRIRAHVEEVLDPAAVEIDELIGQRGVPPGAG